jgi:hypothetical protein
MVVIQADLSQISTIDLAGTISISFHPKKDDFRSSFAFRFDPSSSRADKHIGLFGLYIGPIGK